jgi:pimeloyl-ACP methyl ester carboxylesterase
VNIFYKDWGSGQPIVFSHGWALTTHADEYQFIGWSNRFGAVRRLGNRGREEVAEAPVADVGSVTKSRLWRTALSFGQLKDLGLAFEQTKLRASLVSPAPLYQALAG